MKKLKRSVEDYKKFVLSEWNWPFMRINSGGDKEYACPHFVGHGGLHGCDGCCANPSYKRRGKKK